MEHFISTTNLLMISSAIPLVLVPSVSRSLPIIPNTLITWFEFTIIMHQAMLLTVQARISLVVSALNLLDIPDLVSAPDIISSPTTLSWPHGTKFVDSLLKLIVFFALSMVCADPNFLYFFEDVPLATFQRLADVDYPKSLIMMRKMLEINNSSSRDLFNTSATVRTLSHTIFDCIGTDDFDELVPAKILQVYFKLSTMNSSNRFPGCQ